MKVLPVVRWFLEPEQVKELETEYETFFEFVRCKLFVNLAEQMAELESTINYLAWLTFDPKDEDEEEQK